MRQPAVACIALAAALVLDKARAVSLPYLGDPCLGIDESRSSCGRAGLACVNRTCAGCLSDADCGADFRCSGSTRLNDTTIRLCSRGPLLPHLTGADIGATAAVFLGAALAAGGGVGGGGLFVPVFILLLGFDTNEAVPLSTAVIFGGGLVNYALNARQRHPCSAERPLIAYEVAMAVSPLSLAGTLLGVVGNSLLPAWAVVLVLITLLGYASVRTCKRGAEVRRAERAEPARGPPTTITERPSTEDRDPRSERAEPLLDGFFAERLADAREFASYITAAASRSSLPTHDKTGGGSQSRHVELGEVSSSSATLADGRADENDPLPEGIRVAGQQPGMQAAASSSPPHQQQQRRVRFVSEPVLIPPTLGMLQFAQSERDALHKIDHDQVRPMLSLLALVVGLLLASLLRGGRAGSRSIIGVAPCSSLSWLMLVAMLGALMVVTLHVTRILEARHRRRVHAMHEFLEGDVAWTEETVARIPLVAGIAGVAGGLAGIGGGMITAPLLLELGMLPAVASATSALCVLVSSAAGALQFLVLGMLFVDRALWFGATCMLGTLVGQVVVNRVVRRTKSASFIIFIVAAVMVVAIGLLGFVQVRNFVQSIRNKESLGLRSLCG